MKTATVGEINTLHPSLIRWLEAGEEISISKDGKVIGVIVPKVDPPPRKVDWSKSKALTRDRSGEPPLTAEQAAGILRESRGNG